MLDNRSKVQEYMSSIMGGDLRTVGLKCLITHFESALRTMSGDSLLAPLMTLADASDDKACDVNVSVNDVRIVEL